MTLGVFIYLIQSRPVPRFFCPYRLCVASLIFRGVEPIASALGDKERTSAVLSAEILLIMGLTRLTVAFLFLGTSHWASRVI